MKQRVHTDLIFVRHGETDGNNAGLLQGRGNSHLSANGIRQAEAAAEELASEPFTAACSSDQIRAIETAQIILKKHPGVSLETSPAIEEWFLGDLEGRIQSELLEQMPEMMDKFRYESGDFDVPGGESRQEFQKRVSNYLDDILERFRGGTILLIAHGWTAHRILTHLYGPASPGMLLPVPFNTGISRFRYFNDEKAVQMITWNSVGHLKGISLHCNPVDA